MKGSKLVSWLLVSLFLFSFRAETVSAQGQNLAVWRVQEEGHDFTVAIVPQNGAISIESLQDVTWWEWGNTSDDAYLFDFDNDGYIDLILQFSKENEIPIASLYKIETDLAFGQAVDAEGKLQIGDSFQPEAVIKPRHGSWLINGLPNFELEILSWRNLPHDRSGRYPVQTIVGSDIPGLPQWNTATLLEDPRPNDGYVRFSATLLADSEITYELAEPLMPTWPYLSVGRNWNWYSSPELEVRPLYYDLNSKQISGYWVGFQTAGMYRVVSLSYPPYVDFESPFAWYRFEPSFGKYPNLVIRSDIWPAQSQFGFSLLGEQRTAMRMAWTADQRREWRYLLTVSGNHKMEEQVTIGETVVNAVSYWNLPAWVTNRPWKAVTFVEATNGYPGSEGIYSYSVQDNLPIFSWVNGLTSSRPDIFDSPYLNFPTITPQRLDIGFRGEYSLVYNREPELYFSPIDNRIHLKHAEGGLWNLDGYSVLRTHNLDGDAYINHWSLETVGTESEDYPDMYRAYSREVTEQFYALNGYLLYVGKGQVKIKEADHQLAAFDIVLPTDKDAWQIHRDQLRPTEGQGRDPRDLASWLDAFSGSQVELSGAEANHPRITDDGFRFELTLIPGYQINGADFLNVAGLEVGDYLVEYTDSQFVITPLVLPILNLTTQQLAVEDGRDVIQVTVHNQGTADAADLTLIAEVATERGGGTELERQPLVSLAGETLRLLLDIPPTGATVARLRLENGVGQTMAGKEVVIPERGSAVPEAVFSLVQTPALLPVLLLFAGFIAGAGLLVVARRREL